MVVELQLRASGTSLRVARSGYEEESHLCLDITYVDSKKEGLSTGSAFSRACCLCCDQEAKKVLQMMKQNFQTVVAADEASAIFR